VAVAGMVVSSFDVGVVEAVMVAAVLPWYHRWMADAE